MTHCLEDNCSGYLNNNRASIQLYKDHLSIGVILDFPASSKTQRKNAFIPTLKKILSTSLSSEKKEEDVHLTDYGRWCSVISVFIIKIIEAPRKVGSQYFSLGYGITLQRLLSEVFYSMLWDPLLCFVNLPSR